MVNTSRTRDLECSILSMTMCVSRMESVIIGVTPLSMPKTTTVRGSRMVEGESQEHNFKKVSDLFGLTYPSLVKVTYQGVNIDG
jgi:hypothetical protein